MSLRGRVILSSANGGQAYSPYTPFGAGGQQQPPQPQPQQQLQPQELQTLGWLSDLLKTAAPVLGQIPGVGGVLGPAAGAAGTLGGNMGWFGAGGQQQLQPQQLQTLGWLSDLLKKAAPVLGQIPGVGGVLGPAAGAAGTLGGNMGWFGAGGQQQLPSRSSSRRWAG